MITTTPQRYFPTLFANNLGKQPQKRRTSLLREETAAKQQLCEDAFSHNEIVKSFEYDIITKETQTELHRNSISSMRSPGATSISTQVTPIHLMIINYFGTQCNIEPLNYDDNDEESKTECESSDSDESEYHQSENEYDDDSCPITPITDSGKMPLKTAFVVYWSSIMILLKSCLTCSLLATVKNVTVTGSQLIVALTMSK